jgi:hypothetical protein
MGRDVHLDAFTSPRRGAARLANRRITASGTLEENRENQDDGHGHDRDGTHPQHEDASALRCQIKERMGSHQVLLGIEVSR